MSKNYSNSTLIKSLQIYKLFLIRQIFFLFFCKKKFQIDIGLQLGCMDYTPITPQNRTQKYGSLGS